LLSFEGENQEKENHMTHSTMVQTAPAPTSQESATRIEEAAYYSWLNRGRNAQPGDELNDWLFAEKELRDSLHGSSKVPPPPLPKTGGGKRKI
jgi:hypothetical protein